MRQYELIVITEPTFPHEDDKKRAELIQRLLANQELKIVSEENWGKKKLAYEINKKDEGCYFLVTFNSDSFNAKAIEQQVKLTPSVVRYMVTRVK